MNSEHPTLTIITVTHNSGHLFWDMPDRVPVADWITTIFVDNDSQDGTPAVMAETAPFATVIKNTSNAGFSKAVNLGARRVISDFILLLDPDAYIGLDSLERLITHTNAESEIAISAPLVTDSHGIFDTVGAGLAPTVWRMFTSVCGLTRFGSFFPPIQGHFLLRRDFRHGIDQVEVDWVSGGCMLIKTAAWRELGGLAERWFLHAADIDFCLRAQQLGYRIMVDSSSHAIHEFGQSSDGEDGRADPAWVVNLYELYRLRLTRSQFQSRCWKLVVVFGLLSRAGALKALTLFPRHQKKYAAECHIFVVFALALWKQPSEIPSE